MRKYTIYCTEQQTKKALELGAPIERVLFYSDKKYKYSKIKEGMFKIPTVEQMCGWLRTKGLFVEPYLNGECSYSFAPIVSTKEDGEIIRLEAEEEYKKAALVAIDAALDYLEQKKRGFEIVKEGGAE